LVEQLLAKSAYFVRQAGVEGGLRFAIEMRFPGTESLVSEIERLVAEKEQSEARERKRSRTRDTVFLWSILLVLALPAFVFSFGGDSASIAALLGYCSGIYATIVAQHFPISTGSKMSSSHEWRYMTYDGKPGAYAGPATEKDLYERSHGHGAWKRDERRMLKVLGTIAGGIGVLWAARSLSLGGWWGAGVSLV
jgi:hypothetical protein